MISTSAVDEDVVYDMGPGDYYLPLTEVKSLESSPKSPTKLSLEELTLTDLADSQTTDFLLTTSPSTWKRYIDELSGFAYIINEQSGESKWEDDELFDLSISVDAVRPVVTYEPRTESHWVEVMDIEGNTYYFNQVILLISCHLPCQ